MKTQELAKWQVSIYWLHDSKDFDGLTKAAKNIYLSIGYDEITSRSVGILISEAYQIADDAEIAMKSSQTVVEFQLYNKAKRKLQEAERLLSFQEGVAQYQINWWMFFRHKKTLKVLLNIFLQHKPREGLNILDSVYLCYFLAKIGFAHNKRDVEEATRYAVKYWAILEKKKTRGYPFLG